jgi:hypothetical protein
MSASEANNESKGISSINLYKIGVFDDIVKARHAVEDAIAAGVSKDDITMVAPDNESANDADIDDYSVHPSSDMFRGYAGGALGGAAGGLIGSLMMYIIHRRGLLNAVDNEFVVGSIVGLFVGILTGAAISLVLPVFSMKWFGHRMAPDRESIRDTIRSASAGAIGGMFGAFAGMLGSYLMGIPTLWYFVGTGFFSAAAAVIVGGLVGAMSGRGLAAREVAQWEDITDDDQNVLVSIDCHHIRERLADIEELLRRDGAMLIRTA